MNDLGTLRRQQQALAQAVRGGRPPPRRLLQPAPQGHQARIDAYQHAYQARLAGALRDNFEVLALAMGDEAFAALARAYTEAHPSRQPSIRWFGHRLADFMARRVDQDDGLVPHPAMVDMARMDWALRSAFDATDAPAIDAAALTQLPADAWPRLRCTLHPSVQRVGLSWAIEPAWHALRSHATATVAGTVPAEPELAPPEPLDHTLLVWRRDLATQWRSLGAAEATLLAALASGRPFAYWCGQAAALAERPDDAVPMVVGLIRQWLTDGLISTANV